MKKILSTLAIAALVFNFTSCVVDDRKMDNNGTGIVTYELTATKTVQNIKAFNNTSAPLQYTADDIIEAYVTSSDETGTFYNTICMQDIAVNTAQPIGLSVSANFSSFGKGFSPGRKVFIKLKHNL